MILIGFPGSGKSFLGAAVAQRFNLSFIDTDYEIEKIFQERHRQSLTCRAIAHQYGPSFFCELESEVVKRLPISPPSIIATGGSTPLHDNNRRILEKLGRLIYLRTPFATIAERLLAHLPLPTYIDSNNPLGSLEELYHMRSPLYQQMAQTTIDTDKCTHEELLTKIVEAFHEQ